LSDLMDYDVRMPRATSRRLVARGVRLALMAGMLAPVLFARPVRADRVPPTAAIATPDPEASGRRPFVRREATARRAEASEGADGWWLGTAGVALALALFGGISLASRRYLPQREGGPMRVVGRTSLSPKQTVYLLRVGERVLIVGAGPQGPPSLLGELTDPAELRRYAPRHATPPAQEPAPSAARFDRRVGDEP
jgi:flagellar protein FliO/FliZ